MFQYANPKSNGRGLWRRTAGGSTHPGRIRRNRRRYFCRAVELARANAPTAHFVHASAYHIQIGAHDAVVALGEPLTYHDDAANADDVVSRFFQRVAGESPPWLVGPGVQVTIGLCWLRQQRTRLKEPWSGT
jgi:hypothetical protein